VLSKPSWHVSPKRVALLTFKRCGRRKGNADQLCGWGRFHHRLSRLHLLSIWTVRLHFRFSRFPGELVFGITPIVNLSCFLYQSVHNSREFPCSTQCHSGTLEASKHFRELQGNLKKRGLSSQPSRIGSSIVERGWPLVDPCSQ